MDLRFGEGRRECESGKFVLFGAEGSHFSLIFGTPHQHHVLIPVDKVLLKRNRTDCEMMTVYEPIFNEIFERRVKF